MEKSLDTNATCVAIVFKNPPFHIAKFKAEDGSPFTLKGEMDIRIGGSYNITAAKDNKGNYPDTYNLISISYDIDFSKCTVSEMKVFLKSFMTSTQADNLFREFKEVKDVVVILEESDTTKLKKVKGIGEATADRIVEWYWANKDTSEAQMVLSKYGLTIEAINKVCKHFKGPANAIKFIEENPYNLMKVPGFGFGKADAAFLAVPSNSPSDIRRVIAFISFLFDDEYQNGNTWITPSDFIKKFQDYLPMADEKDAIKYINESKDYKTIHMDETEYPRRVASMRNIKLEIQIAKELNRLMDAESKLKLENVEKTIKSVEEEQGFEFSEEQRQAINNMVKMNVYMVQGLSGSGKAQRNDMIIPTPDGKKRFGDLKVGDYVFDRNGNSTQVTGVYPRGKLKEYKVILADGRSTICNDDHLWTTYTSKGNFRTRTLREMLDMGLYHGTKGVKQGKWKIPTNQPINYPERELKVDPYVVGVLLGDGYLKGERLSLSSNDEDVVSEVCNLMGADSYKRNSQLNYSWTFKWKESRTNHYTDCYNNQLSAQYNIVKPTDLFPQDSIVLNTSHQKGIPDEYKYSSIEQRYSIIQGLLDTDGTISRSEGRYNIAFSTTSERLRDDFREVLWSLGIQTSLLVDTHKENIAYQVNVLVDNCMKPKLFRNTHKKAMANEAAEIGGKKHRDYTKIAIRDVIDLGTESEMTCIMVDNDEHLYLCNDYIVTHNTSAVRGYLKTLDDNNYLYHQCALSGKAAKNLELVTGKRGSTIHSLLAIGTPIEVDNLYTDCVVLDELSMVSADIFLKLLRAIPSGAKLIMLGDYGQLEAIGVGVMGGLIRSKAVPMTLLRKIHRQAQASAIITHSIAVRQGLIPEGIKFKTDEEVRTYGEKQDLDYIFVSNDKEENILKHTMATFKQSLQEYDINDIQIICATRTAGKVSVAKINQFAQMIANPPDDFKPEVTVGFKDNQYILRRGDRVINVKNTRDTESPDSEPRPIFNGNTGIIKDVFDIEERGEKKGQYIIVDFDGIGEVKVMPKHMNNIELGYAMTIHKSQGSTIKCVIFAMPFHYMLNSKELMYTAMTRASKHLTVITSPRTMRGSVAKSSTVLRKTNLEHYLKDVKYWSRELLGEDTDIPIDGEFEET